MIVTCKLLNEDGTLYRPFGCSLIFGAAMARSHAVAGRSAYLMHGNKIIAVYRDEKQVGQDVFGEQQITPEGK